MGDKDPEAADVEGEGGEGEGPEDTIGEYEGERNELKERHGLGRAVLPNGDYYEGMYRKGLRNGLGLYVFTNGARYNGHYHKGKKQGIGTFYYPDGTRYEGEWRNDLRHGYGVYYYANGDIYEGQWRNGLREGLGCYIYKGLGAKYLGSWREGKMTGPGQIITSAFRYHGTWYENMMEGKGVFTFKSNVMQHGHMIHIQNPLYEMNEVYKTKPIQTERDDDDEEKAALVALWRGRELAPYNPSRLPPAPVPFQYPASDISETPPPSPKPDDGTYGYDFFDDIAQYNKFYLDEKVIRDADKWGAEIKPVPPPPVSEEDGGEGGESRDEYEGLTTEDDKDESDDAN
ncbi:MORN [Nesidiocoris tenuis]|uniref:MORN n=1 Tax=Nesidiocoris tenuis TaxID=355587 RepID=A0ABN7AQY4_9HEMI|nr:MORN [Nesidiocoris tenuis]